MLLFFVVASFVFELRKFSYSLRCETLRENRTLRPTEFRSLLWNQRFEGLKDLDVYVLRPTNIT